MCAARRTGLPQGCALLERAALLGVSIRDGEVACPLVHDRFPCLRGARRVGIDTRRNSAEHWSAFLVRPSSSFIRHPVVVIPGVQ
jgi:hypothetical protein